MPHLAAGEAPPRSAPEHDAGGERAGEGAGASLLVRLEGFEGPLDLLLELARRQQVDLARISVLVLVDQYLDAIERLGMAATGLERAADWLVMAAWLTWLKSRLLLPKTSPAAEEGERAAGVLVDRLGQIERVRRLAAWLEARPQLGRDTYARGAPEAPGLTLAGDVAGLLRACLIGLRRPAAQSDAPRRPLLWRVADAIARLRALLGVVPDGAELMHFVPSDRLLARPDRQPTPAKLRRQRCGAVAATLVGALELARDGSIDLHQREPFGAIRVHLADYRQRPG